MRAYLSPRCLLGIGGFAFLVLLLLMTACKKPTPEEEFRRRHNREHDCMFGRMYRDCAELAQLEEDAAAQDKWLELGCTHGEGDLCVKLVGTWDHRARESDDARAIALLTQGCAAKRPGRACSELLFRKVDVLRVSIGATEGLDEESVAIAERACALGGGSVTMMGFGPGACYFAARAHLEGLGGKTVDRGRAIGLLEQGCLQELSVGGEKSGPSCFFAARLLRDQPLFGEELPDRAPIDAARARTFLERGCANGQSDSCTALEGLKPR